MKPHVGLLWSVTIFMVAIFCQPGLLLRACVANTNYLSKAMFVNEAKIVPIVDERLQPEPEKDKVIGPVIFFVIVLAAFAYIVYQLIKLMDKIIPPPEKQPDPPPSSGNTNYPPIVINPTQGPGPATASFKTLTITSNTPYWGAIQPYDITALHYRNTEEKFMVPVYYDTFWSTGMKTSMNMVDWEDTHYRIDCYINSTYGAVCYAYFHYDTNWWNCYYTTDYIATNHMAPAWFNLSDGPRKPNQFFRLDPR
jgi:hypothetical protein